MRSARRQITPAIERKIRELVVIAGTLNSELLSVGEVLKARSDERSRAAENLVNLEAELRDATTARRWNRAGQDGEAAEQRLERVKNDLANEQRRDAGIASEIETLEARKDATREAWDSAGNIAEIILRQFGTDRQRIEGSMRGTR